MESEKGSYTPQINSPAPAMAIPSSRGFQLAQLTLRILAIAFALCSISITVTSDESVTLFGLAMKASYTYSSSFKFQVGANAVACGFVLCSVVAAAAFSRSKSNPNLYFYMFLNDMVMTLLVISGCAAATAIGFVGRYGQDKSGWFPICDRVPKFCHKMTLALAFSYLSFFSLLSLTVLSAYKLKSLATTTTL